MQRFSKKNIDNFIVQAGASHLMMLVIILVAALVWGGGLSSKFSHNDSNTAHIDIKSQTSKLVLNEVPKAETSIISNGKDHSEFTKENDISISDDGEFTNNRLPITHYNQYPTYTNSPEALRGRQIYEEVAVKRNFSQELMDEYFSLRQRSEGPEDMYGKFRVNFTVPSEMVDHLMDDILRDLFSKTGGPKFEFNWQGGSRKVEYKPKEFSLEKQAHRIKMKEAFNRAYDYFHYQLGGPRFKIQKFSWASAYDSLFIRVASDDKFIRSKLEKLEGLNFPKGTMIPMRRIN